MQAITLKKTVFVSESMAVTAERNFYAVWEIHHEKEPIDFYWVLVSLFDDKNEAITTAVELNQENRRQPGGNDQ